MARNYYIILGVDDDASQEEIRSAYRRLAKELHPDHSGTEDSSSFKEVQQAYSTLRDPDMRREYDRHLHHKEEATIPVEVRRNRRSPIEPIEPTRRGPAFDEVFITRSFDIYSPSFEEIFDRLRSAFREVEHPKSERLQSLSVEIRITREQAHAGGLACVAVPVHVRCWVCGGTGGVGLFECPRCLGAGVVDREVPIHVRFPSGVRNGHIVRIPLDRFGIRNFYLTVYFRVTDSQK